MKEIETEQLIETLRRQQALSDKLQQSHLRLQSAVAGGSVRVAWHREQRRYYLHAAILALLLAAVVDACSPASGTAAVRNSHNMTRSQAVSETTKLMVTGEKA